jgi:hypothetical protein
VNKETTSTMRQRSPRLAEEKLDANWQPLSAQPLLSTARTTANNATSRTKSNTSLLDGQEDGADGLRVSIRLDYCAACTKRWAFYPILSLNFAVFAIGERFTMFLPFHRS